MTESPGNTSARAGRTVFRTVGVVLLAVAVTAAGLYAARTWIAAEVVKTRLAALGVADVSLAVTRLDTQGLTIENFSAEKGAATIGRLEATYTIGQLRAGRIAALTIDGASLSLALEERGLMLGQANLNEIMTTLSGDSTEPARLPLASLRVDNGAIALATGQGTAKGTFAFTLSEVDGFWAVNGNVAAEGGGVTVDARGEGKIDPARLAASSGTARVVLRGADVAVPGVTQRAAVDAAFTATAKDGALSLATTKPLHVKTAALDKRLMARLPTGLAPYVANGVEMRSAKLSVRQSSPAGTQAPFAVDGDLTVIGGGITLETRGQGQVNLARLASSSGEATVALRAADVAVPQVTARASVDAALSVSAKNGALSVAAVKPVNIKTAALEKELAARLPPALAVYVADGFAAEIGTLTVDQARGVQTVMVRAAETNLRGQDAAIAGLGLTVTFKSLAPVALDGAAGTASSITVGDMVFRNIAAEANFPAAGPIAVKHVAFDLASGHISTRDVSWPLAGGFTVAAQRLDLHQLAAMIDVDGLDMKGTLSGTIPITREGADFRVAAGALAAQGGGTIHYRPAEPPAALTSNPGGALALQALANFVYDDLTLTITGSVNDTLDVLLGIKGRNPDVYNGYPIALNLNLSGKLIEILRQGFGAAQVSPTTVEELRKTR